MPSISALKPQPPLHGGCLCGGTRYVLSATPQGVNDCHCLDCRRSSGAPFVTWGGLPREHYHLAQGSVRNVSHENRVRHFAACCGTQLLMEDSTDAPEVEIAIATLDDPTPFPPEKVIWTTDKLPWVVLDLSLPSYDQGSENTA